MVRTYAFNASSRSDVFEQYKHTASTPLHQNNGGYSRRSQDTISPSYSDSRIKNNESPLQANSNQNYQNSNVNTNSHSNNVNFPPINQSNIYQSSFHSSMIDPIGSIVGLRLIYMDGQLVYVPVEPQLNFLINKHFGSSNQLPVMPQLPNPMTTSLPPIQQFQQPQFRDDYQIHQNQQHQQQSMKTDWNDNYTDNRKNSIVNGRNSGSLPNLSQQQKPVLSLQDQHKLDLAKQIEDNKRRREAEKQKEYELEQREIRRWEEYQAKIRDEEERDRRAVKEKAMAMERRNEQIYEQQRIESENRKREHRRQSYAKPQQQNNYRSQNSFDEEPIRAQRQSEDGGTQERRYSNSEYIAKPPSRPIRQESHTPPQQTSANQSRPDSSQPREIEWWEKKPTNQERQTGERKSAVIPTLRGKPPAVPDSQRSNSEQQTNTSRPSSRTTQTRNSIRTIANENESEIEQPKRSSAKHKAPTAFTISA
ncbi:unnamed protein product [Caenorhabditis angaria]|uniref:Uncharacterized protein n=1 Tax=Caenorhabditis angaria TaxID=860376 RepID=A0A9P1J235_9PELO|nr:unnamed protein product [Caenorhabditis angaria]